MVFCCCCLPLTLSCCLGRAFVGLDFLGWKDMPQKSDQVRELERGRVGTVVDKTGSFFVVKFELDDIKYLEQEKFEVVERSSATADRSSILRPRIDINKATADCLYAVDEGLSKRMAQEIVAVRNQCYGACGFQSKLQFEARMFALGKKKVEILDQLNAVVPDGSRWRARRENLIIAATPHGGLDAADARRKCELLEAAVQLTSFSNVLYAGAAADPVQRFDQHADHANSMGNATIIHMHCRLVSDMSAEETRLIEYYRANPNQTWCKLGIPMNSQSVGNLKGRGYVYVIERISGVQEQLTRSSGSACGSSSSSRAPSSPQTTHKRPRQCDVVVVED